MPSLQAAQLANLHEVSKGAVFLADLKRQLLLEGFTVAIPEPDLGDDLWVMDLQSESAEEARTVATIPILERLQVKSALSTKFEGPDRVYTVNFAGSYRSRLAQHFYYLIGLYDSEDVGYHVACVPSTYFLELEKRGHLRFNAEGRPLLDFFLSTREDFPKYTMRLTHPVRPGYRRSRGDRADVCEFFSNRPFRETFGAYASQAPRVVIAPPTGLKPGPKKGSRKTK